MTAAPNIHGNEAERQEFLRRRARRNRAILFTLAGMVVLFYVLSIVRLGAG